MGKINHIQNESKLEIVTLKEAKSKVESKYIDMRHGMGNWHVNVSFCYDSNLSDDTLGVLEIRDVNDANKTVFFRPLLHNSNILKINDINNQNNEVEKLKKQIKDLKQLLKMFDESKHDAYDNPHFWRAVMGELYDNQD